MLYAHGPDLCRESDLRHAMANCFEALIGEVSHETKIESWDDGFTGEHKKKRNCILSELNM